VLLLGKHDGSFRLTLFGQLAQQPVRRVEHGHKEHAVAYTPGSER
jgi:hypothetical protein